MPEIMQDLTPEHMKLIGGLIGAIIGTAIATAYLAMKGSKRTPVEGGSTQKTDRLAYIQADIRSLQRKFEALHYKVDEVLDAYGRHTERLSDKLDEVHNDTQVIRDRGRRE